MNKNLTRSWVIIVISGYSIYWFKSGVLTKSSASPIGRFRNVIFITQNHDAINPLKKAKLNVIKRAWNSVYRFCCKNGSTSDISILLGRGWANQMINTYLWICTNTYHTWQKSGSLHGRCNTWWMFGFRWKMKHDTCKYKCNHSSFWK